MKVLFAGPSIYGATLDLAGIELRPPAAQSDILQAVVDGANVIGLVDGNFEAIASVWHKEILFAISEGVIVFGASSMGALRAAECAFFGMIPVGKIAEEYANGDRDDDADVALCHGPFELGSPPTTMATVDVEATVSAMLQSDCITPLKAQDILDVSRRIFFKQRDVNAIFSFFTDSDKIRESFQKKFVNQKKKDALLLIDILKNTPNKRSIVPAHFHLERPHSWVKALQNINPTSCFSTQGKRLSR